MSIDLGMASEGEFGTGRLLPRLAASSVRGNVVRLGQAYWEAKCQPGRLPSRADIDPSEIPQLLPHVLLLDVQREPLDFRFRLIGGGVVAHLSRDWTGSWMSQVPEMRPPNRILGQCRGVVHTGSPSRSRSNYRGPHSNIVAEEDVILPLANDGEAVDMLLGFVEYLGRR